MRIQLNTRKLMLIVVILSACLALGRRIWLNEWAPFYHRRYQEACRWVVALQQDEARYRAAGDIRNARSIQRILETADGERRDNLWKWVKAILLDEP